MQGGHVEQIGAPLDLYDRQPTWFVAGFIGRRHDFLKGKVVAGGVAIGDCRWTCPTEAAARRHDVVYGIRPEHGAWTMRAFPALSGWSNRRARNPGGR